jgi:23S rRNA pseudouridine1911/1915/1917 synthase
MKINVKEEQLLTEVLHSAFGEASKTTIKQWITHGSVKVNGRLETNPATKVKPEDVVEYNRQKLKKVRHRSPFPLYCEDEFIVVAEKPAGLLTVGDRGTGGTSFYQQMLNYIKANSDGKEKLYVVHRLDREVSGLLVFAKTEKVQEQMKEQWNKVIKRYYALVEGDPPKERDTIVSWLMEGGDQKVRSVREQEGAKKAVTRYRVMDRTAGFSLLEVELETGRKNQIRVHLSEMGCPVVGDRRYGADAKFVRRIRLHAFYLSFPHPATGELLEFKSKMPAGFLTLRPEDEKYK